MRQHQPLSFIMAENKKSFILYCDQKGVWDKLDDAQAGRLIKHIIAYVNDDNPSAPDFITELAFEPIKQSLKRDLKKWNNQQGQRSEAGKRSAEVRKRNAQLAQRDSTTVNDRSISSTDSVNGSVSVNANVSVNDIEERYIHPLIEWIEENTPRVQQLKEPITEQQAERIVKEYEIDFIYQVLSNMHNYKKLSSTVVSANLTFRKWAKKDLENQNNGKQTRAEQALHNIASGANKELDKITGFGSF